MTYINKNNEENFDENDAILFNLLVDVYTAKKYEQYTEQNEEFKQEPCFDELPELDDRCFSAIRKEYKKKEFRQMRKNAFRVIQSISVAVAAIVILCMLIVAVSPVAKANVLSFFAVDNEQYTTIKANTNNMVSKSDITFNNAETFGYAIPPAPDGFALARELTSSIHYSAVYKGPNYRRLSISIYKLSDASYNIDTEDAEVSYIELNGLEGLYYEKSVMGTFDILKSITLVNSEIALYITVSGVNVDKDTLISFAEQIEFVG